MGLYLPKRVVLNWFRYDVSFSLELIASFVSGVDRQATASLDTYNQSKEVLVKEVAPEEGIVDVVEIHEGLDSESWHMETIFGEYFPNLHRRSALLTVCGYFEHELDKLCMLYQSEKAYKLALQDLTGKGIDRAAKYLQKAGRPFRPSTLATDSTTIFAFSRTKWLGQTFGVKR